MNTLNLDRLAAVLSGILSDRYGAKVTVTLEGNEKDSNGNNNNCPVLCDNRRLGA